VEGFGFAGLWAVAALQRVANFERTIQLDDFNRISGRVRCAESELNLKISATFSNGSGARPEIELNIERAREQTQIRRSVHDRLEQSNAIQVGVRRKLRRRPGFRFVLFDDDIHEAT
jgi:hypothetical protein